MLGISQFRQNSAKIRNFAKTFKISPGPFKISPFSHFDENFASLATLILAAASLPFLPSGE